MQKPSDSEKQDLTNVSHQFYVLYFFGILINLMQAVWAVAACFVTQAKQACQAATQAVIFVISGVYLAIVTHVRFDHAGEVCSGDYLMTSTSLQTRKQGILGIEGQFWAVYIIAGYIQLFIIVIYMTVHWCAKDGKNSPDKERDM